MYRRLTDRSLKSLGLLISVALLLVAPRLFASTDYLDGRYNRLLSSATSAVTTHTIGFTISDTGTPVGSIRIQYCANTPIVGDVCTPINGFDASGVIFDSQNGETGFAISGLSTLDEIILTRPAALPTGNPAEFEFSNIINPSSSGAYYVRLETFTSIDATGANIEQGGIAFAINSGLNVSAVVPPYLRFCAAVSISSYDCTTTNDYLINMGEFNATTPITAASEFVVATNATFGYSVTISGTTLTSGNNIISPMNPIALSIPGTSQFGINLRSNNSPTVGADPSGPGTGGVIAGVYNTPNQFRFQNGDVIVSSPGVSDNQKFTVSYITNISPAQAAGFYATTMTYIALANF